MAIPTFPSQDLAKLVLGYLNEEQLITVYDEFLQTSPYLDAQKNEYDRIFMKSLRSILNEYWSIKIFVEKCKPFALRKKLSQCNGLLEVVKYLISHVDLRRIPNITQDKNGLRASKILPQHTSMRDKECNICGAIQPENCVCTNSTVKYSDVGQTHFEATTSSIVEATSLTDLPGSSKRKQVKVLERDSSDAERFMSSDPHDSSPTKSLYSSSTVDNQTETVGAPACVPEAPMQYNHTLSNKQRTAVDTNQNIQDVNEVIGGTATDNGAVSNDYRPKPESVANRRTSAASFEEFATGVQAGIHVDTSIPDSSTSETTANVLPTAPRDGRQILQQINQLTLPSHHLASAGRTTQYLIQINSKNLALLATSAASSPVDSKVTDSKVTILSDVKVDKHVGLARIAPKKPPVLQNQCPASTHLMQMQAILVNGTPAYKPSLQGKRAFTEDEIMAMPTVFLVTAPGPPPMVNTMKTTMPQMKNVSVSSSTNTAPSLGRLTVDIAHEGSQKPPGEIKSMPSLNPLNGTGLVTTVDLRNASVPKESTNSKTSTPQCPPVLRKSSSTPRRNSSHVRVLDFTTPRRILDEAINENEARPIEIILSQSPSTHDQPMSVAGVETKISSEAAASTAATGENSSKESTVGPPSSKKYNWDADLRALCTQTVTVAKPKSAKKKKPVEISQKPNESDTSIKKPKSKKKHSSKPKTPKSRKHSKKEVAEEPLNVELEPKEVPVKPTINIVTDWHATEPEKTENKSSGSGNNQSDTPDMDRTSLQNAIGAKLNISELLETPYKQALYDIQMETPRFLRSDIPLAEEPISEIKITDIPTPRFFDTPGFGFACKSVQAATPSSYSSRPTDYSSGGSYYKPDDQDYAPHPEDLGCPVEEKDTQSEKPNDKPTRPVRKCTKNVSYTYSDTNRAPKETTLQQTSNDTSVTSTDVSKGQNKDTSVTENEKKPLKERRKSTSKKRKSPVKKMTPKFLKIKPRRPTPEKATKKKSYASESSQSRKRNTSKDSTSSATPSVVPAPTKSRRKSSTPRKLHTKVLISPSPESSESIKDTIKPVALSAHDSDTENVPLRWSDDCSQDANIKSNLSSVNDEEDISKIKDYIEKSLLNKSDADNSMDPIKEPGSLHKDLVKRGFDIETARSIERDLLDASPSTSKTSPNSCSLESNKPIPSAKRSFEVEIVDRVGSDSSQTNLLNIREEDEDIEEIELSIYECNEESDVNFFVSEHIESLSRPINEHHRLKDNFTMEFCLEEDFSVRLKTTALTFLLDNPTLYDESVQELGCNENISIKETEEAVNSIPNFERLYTPLKHNRQAPLDTLIEVFDSSLTSLDTPLKATSPKYSETPISEIVLEVEPIVEKDDSKGKSKKRQRKQSGSCSDESLNESKRNKREILPNIQNFDIESVLSKLHGP